MRPMQGGARAPLTGKKGTVAALGKTAAYVKGGVGVIAFALVLAALGAILTIIGPDKIGQITDLMSEGLATGIDLAALQAEIDEADAISADGETGGKREA